MRTIYTLGKWSHLNLAVWANRVRAWGIIPVSEGDDSAPPVKVVIICLYSKQVTHEDGIEDYLQVITKMSSPWSL